jgi:hypothetical protein
LCAVQARKFSLIIQYGKILANNEIVKGDAVRGS